MTELTIETRVCLFIVEGILAQHPEFLARLYDTKIFVDTASDICFIRRLERDVSERGRTMEQVIAQYKRDVKPMYEQFVEPCRNRADIIIENSDEHFTTTDGVHFDIHPIIACLTTEKQSSEQAKFKLFSKPRDIVPQTTTLSTWLCLSSPS